MSEQQQTGIGIIVIILFILWWLSKNALGFLHGMQVSTSVQTSILGPDGQPVQTNEATTTGSGCCS